MIKSYHIDGVAFERDNFPCGAYVYQSIRTFGHKALHVEESLHLLRKASLTILHCDRTPSKADIELQISDFLRKNGYPSAMPAFVELRLYHSGEVVLLGGEVSPYPQYGFRLLMPSATDIEYEIPHPEHRSSLRRAAAEIAKIEAESQGCNVAICIDHEGFAHSTDDAEMFVVREYSLFTPHQPRTIEGIAVVEAIARSGLQLSVEPISCETLDLADEIFYADHRGITALGSRNGKPLMHILAEKIASHLR